jgi:hypothetical protein
MSENQAAGHSKKNILERWKDRVRGSAQPGRLNPFSRDHSRQSSRAPSPVPSRGKADHASAIAGASSSTPEIRPGVDDDSQRGAGATVTRPAIKLGAVTNASHDGENQTADLVTNMDATDSAQEDDMWKIAEAQLRQDEKMNELLDAYYEILKSKLKDLDSLSTPERQKQISAFIESEAESFQDASKLGTFASVLEKAAKCILKAENIISAAAQPCLPASIACAGVMLVLSVSSSLLLMRQMLMLR